jgi:anti-sigma regulatory factor (Ser/Thr protein kinase)
LVIDRPLRTGAFVRWSYPPQPETPGVARRQLDPVLEGWEIGPEDRWAALLVMNELVTNAVEHAGTGLSLVVTRTSEGLLIEVSDESSAEPRLQKPGVVERRGHGLRVVQGLTCRWDWTPTPGGKTVWATVPLTGADGSGPGDPVSSAT